jgi:hypothetical protein
MGVANVTENEKEKRVSELRIPEQRHLYSTVREERLPRTGKSLFPERGRAASLNGAYRLFFPVVFNSRFT